MIVLGSQVFGRGLMESCAVQCSVQLMVEFRTAKPLCLYCIFLFYHLTVHLVVAFIITKHLLSTLHCFVFTTMLYNKH